MRLRTESRHQILHTKLEVGKEPQSASSILIQSGSLVCSSQAIVLPASRIGYSIGGILDNFTIGGGRSGLFLP